MSNKNSIWKWAAAYFIGAGVILAANPDCNLDITIPGEPKPRLEERVELEKIKPRKLESDVLPPTGCREYVDILVDLNQKIGDERETLTENDLPHLLASSRIGNTKINQYLKFEMVGCILGDSKSQTVTYDGKENVFFIKEKDILLSYQLEFEEGLRSDIDSNGNLTYLVGQQINILGHQYNITKATKSSLWDIDLTFIADDFKIQWTNKASDLAIMIEDRDLVFRRDAKHNERAIEYSSVNLYRQTLKNKKFEIQTINYKFAQSKDLALRRGESLRQKLDKDNLPGLKLDMMYAGRTENNKHVVRVYERE